MKKLVDALATSGLAAGDRGMLRTDVTNKDGQARVYVTVRARLEHLSHAARALLRGLGED